jgi:transcription antitermination factor NusG
LKALRARLLRWLESKAAHPINGGIFNASEKVVVMKTRGVDVHVVNAIISISVSRLVVNGDQPVAVPEGVVHALRAREDEKGFIQLDSRLMFTPGDKVRVLTGAFAEMAGLFGGLADHDRVSILLDMLGRKAWMFVDVDMIAVT